MVQRAWHAFWLIVPVALCLAGGIGSKPIRGEEPGTSKAPQQAIDNRIAELKRVAELVKQLDDPQFDKREQATAMLLKMGRPAIEPLRLVLTAKPSLEVATRVEDILKRMPKDEPAEKLSLSQVCQHLAKTITLEKGIDPNTPLGDALDYLSNQVHVPIRVDKLAFEAIGVQQVREQSVQLPKMRNASLAEVVHRLAAQIKGDVYVGTYLVRPGYLEITTTYNALCEVSGTEAGMLIQNDIDQFNRGGRSRLMGIVHAAFQKRPLADALQQLADSAGVTVIVDPRVGDKAKTPVTAALPNVFVDTAFELLADMAELQVVQLDAVLYVTTRDNAAKLEARLKARQPKPAAVAPNAMNPLGLGPAPGLLK